MSQPPSCSIQALSALLFLYKEVLKEEIGWLDELIRATRGAHNALLDLEELEEDNLDAFKQKYQALAADARAALDRGGGDTGTPEP